MSMYKNFLTNYAVPGAYAMWGFDPTEVGPNNSYINQTGWGSSLKFNPGEVLADQRTALKTGANFSRGVSALTTIGAGYNIYSGYKENGFWGAYDAAVWDIAVGSAVSRFAHGTLGSSGPSSGISFRERLASIGSKINNTTNEQKIVFGGGAGGVAGFARLGGSAIGASIGQELLGTPGAFVGAYIGAAPIRFAATHPLIGGGMALVGAAAGAGYLGIKGATAVVRAGAEHRQRQRSIDTSGSMAAFMTNNAHTARARAVQAMHKSHLNARSALGQEASFMHMPGKNYHSRYR